MARKTSTANAVKGNAVKATARIWLHRSGGNVSDYASTITPVDLNVVSPAYLASLANGAAVAQLREILGYDRVSQIDAEVTRQYVNVARDHVSYVSGGRGMFAYRKFSAATNPDRQHFYAEGMRQIGHLPLLRINFVRVNNGSEVIDRTIIVATDASAFFVKATERRTTPDVARIFGYLLTDRKDKNGANVTTYLATDTLLTICELARINGEVINHCAAMITAVAPFVADTSGTLPQSVTNPTPQTVAIPATPTAAAYANDLQAMIAAAVNDAVAKTVAAMTAQTVNAMPIDLTPAPLTVDAPSPVPVTFTAPLVKATANKTRKTVKNAPLTAAQLEAIALADAPGRKKREDNQKIVNNLPDSWARKDVDGSVIMTAKERRQQAQNQIK